MSTSKKSGGTTNCKCPSSSSSSSCKSSKSGGGGGCSKSTEVYPGCYEGSKNGVGNVTGSLSGAKEKENELKNKLKQECGFSEKCAADAAKQVFDKIKKHFDQAARGNQDIPAGNYDEQGCFIGGNCEFSLCSDDPVNVDITCHGDRPELNIGPVTNTKTNHDCGKPWEPPGGWPPEYSNINCDPPYPPPPPPQQPDPF